MVFFFLNSGSGPNVPSDENKVEIPVKDHAECIERAYFWGEPAEHEGMWFLCIPPGMVRNAPSFA
jgi:hypothetical protein